MVLQKLVHGLCKSFVVTIKLLSNARHHLPVFAAAGSGSLMLCLHGYRKEPAVFEKRLLLRL